MTFRNHLIVYHEKHGASSKGYKVIPQRLVICKLILSSRDHPSAEQLYKEANKTYPVISLTTVYITLDLLKKLGLVQELGFSDRSSGYDPNNFPHVNVVCPKCGKIYDYESANVKKMLTQVVAEAGLKPLRQRLDLYALCANCKTKTGT